MAPLRDRTEQRAVLHAGLAALGLTDRGVDAERLLDYVALLARWNAVYNLTAVRDPLDMITRHVLDCLSVVPWVSGANLADIGSGAGFPGIPLALAAPQRQVVLIDANGKKVRFLREAVRNLGLTNVTVEQQRVENARGNFDCVTARAFASLADMLTLGGHLLAPSGVWLALKGQLAGAEMAALPAGFRVSATPRLRVPGLDAQRHLVVITRTLVQSQHVAA